MKILHVIHAYSPAIGGAEFLIQQVSEYLANVAKEDVAVFTTFAYNTSLFTDSRAPMISADRKNETINGVKIKRFPVRNQWGRMLYFLQYIFYRFRLLGNARLRMLFYGPISPLMKKAIKNGDLKLAVTLILKKVQPLLENGDLENIPKVFWYEKNMLRHLKKYPNDYAGALRKIPKRIRRLYIHAYQSYIFNEELRQNILENQVPKTITIQGFAVPRMPELKASQLERRSLLVAKDFKVLSVTNSTVKLRFTLLKGEYASTFLSFLVNRKK